MQLLLSSEEDIGRLIEVRSIFERIESVWSREAGDWGHCGGALGPAWPQEGCSHGAVGHVAGTGLGSRGGVREPLLKLLGCLESTVVAAAGNGGGGASRAFAAVAVRAGRAADSGVSVCLLVQATTAPLWVE